MTSDKNLHWTQRIALVQHNLHAASRTGDFNFFSNIQSNHFLHGTDYVAHLNTTIGDEADKLISVLDNHNAGIAWCFEDSFKTIYQGLKAASESAQNVEKGADDHQKALLTRLHLDITRQRAETDIVIDKLMSSAVAMIKRQPQDVHEDAAMAFMLGTTFIADAVHVCLTQLQVLRSCIADMNMANADAASALVTFAVSAAVSALKGVLNMMELHEDTAGEAVAAHARRSSIASFTSLTGSNAASSRSRTASQASTDRKDSQLPSPISATSDGGAWNVFRRMSSAFSSGPPPTSSGRASTASLQSSSGSSNKSFSTPHLPALAPSPVTVGPLKSQPSSQRRRKSVPAPVNLHGHVLSPILSTPVATADESDALQNPFDSSFAMGPRQQNTNGGDDSQGSLNANEKAWTMNQDTTGRAIEVNHLIRL